MGFATKIQEGAKSSSTLAINLFLRTLTGLILGFTVALIGQEIINYGTLSLVFLNLMVMAMVIKGLSGWSIAKILIFDLICVLVGMLLRMYILLAP